jgi:hypothetical protein
MATLASVLLKAYAHMQRLGKYATCNFMVGYVNFLSPYAGVAEWQTQRT